MIAFHFDARVAFRWMNSSIGWIDLFGFGTPHRRLFGDFISTGGCCSPHKYIQSMYRIMRGMGIQD
jgi:hypothetical protein